ncbi:MAG: ferrous iron transport protein A [Bacillota bacterium]|nr:ferrous iron transport protein A [Bacillota bacterium]
MTLDKIQIGKKARIISVAGEEKLRCHLLDMGLIPHTEVLVCKTAPLGDPIEISLRGYTMTIRKDDASKIEVRPEGEV